MTDPDTVLDPGNGENLDQIYTALRWHGVGLTVQRLNSGLMAEVSAAIAHEQRLQTFEVIVPDETERADLLDAAGGDLERAISLAQWGIPPALAREHPNADIHALAHRAHIDRSTT